MGLAVQYLIEPWKHQLVAIERAKPLPYFGLFFEMGAGKTSTTINILRHKMLLKKEKRLRAIIFCPPIVIPNWRDEWLKNSKLEGQEIVMLQGTGLERIKTFRKNAYQGQAPVVPVPKIFITNYESLLMGELFREFTFWAPEALVFDESHKLKNYKAKRSKLAEVLANPRPKEERATPLKYILTGSPVLNSPMDLFFQFLILDGGATFGNNFFVFRARYFIDKNAGMPKQKYFPNWVVAPGAIDEINKLLFQHGMRVEKKDCLDLPEEVAVTIKVKMTADQARNYAEMKRDFVTYVGSSAAVATLAIVKGLRLMQIASGFLPLSQNGDEMATALTLYKDTPKEDALRELLEEITPRSKVIVWAVWHENYKAIRRICEELKLKYVEVHGGVARGEQDRNLKSFQEDDSVRVFIGHPGSGGIGINLTCAPYSIFYSRTFSLEHFLQARARNHRGGQTEKVTHYDLVCENTIDELAVKKLADKQDMSDKLLRDFAKELGGSGEAEWT